MTFEESKGHLSVDPFTLHSWCPHRTGEYGQQKSKGRHRTILTDLEITRGSKSAESTKSFPCEMMQHVERL